MNNATNLALMGAYALVLVGFGMLLGHSRLEEVRRATTAASMKASAAEEASARRAAAIVEWKKCFTAEWPIRTAPGCEGGVVVTNVTATSPLPFAALPPSNVADADEDSLWCGVGPTAGVRLEFGAPVVLSRVRVTCSATDRGKRPAGHPKKLRVAWEGGSVEIAYSAASSAVSDRTQDAVVPDVHAAGVEETTTWVEVRQVDGVKAQQLFCLSSVTPSGRAPSSRVRSAAEGTLVLGIGATPPPR